MRRDVRLTLMWGLLLFAVAAACAVLVTTPAPPSTEGAPSPPPALTAPASPTAGLPTATPGETMADLPPPPPDSPWLDVDRVTFRWRADAPSQVAEVWDFVAGETVFEREGRLYVPGGDAYAINVYERPFTPIDQETFLPDLDIRYARLAREGAWMYALIQLYGLNPGEEPLTGQYGLELDLNVDGRGDVLIWARGPWSRTWSVEGVEVYLDADQDVGDAQICASDAPHRRSNGYETLRWRAGQGDLPGAAWVRVRLQAGHPTVEFAFPVSWLATQGEPRLLWRAWSDAQVHDPGQMDYHDTFTLDEAGEPYLGRVPVNALAQSDNTCYTTFGFRPTGLEPCLCRVNDPFHPLCPEAPTAPGERCEDLGADFWGCLTGDGDLAVCHWDPVFCRWDCRSLLLCPPIGRSEDLQAYLEAYLTRLAESGTVRVSIRNDEEAGVHVVVACQVDDEGNLTCAPYLERVWNPEMVTCMRLPDAWVCVGGGLDELTNHPYFDMVLREYLEEGEVAAPTVRQWACTWNPNLCRFECADDQWCLDPATTIRGYVQEHLQRDAHCDFDENARRVICDYGQERQVCDFDPDYTRFLCTTTYRGEVENVDQWVYDPLTCRFERQRLCVQPELEGVCEAVGEDEWLCELWPSEEEIEQFGAPPDDWEPPRMRCRWEQELCQWFCHDCEEPDETCVWDEAQGLWVCPGRGEFDGCEWDVEQCRWRCWGSHQPPPEEEEDEVTCQPENYCREILTGVFQCDDGKMYWGCTYDGCQWTCGPEYKP